MKEKKLNTPFECLSRVDRIDPEVLKSLKEAGCFRIWFGAESGSQKMIDKMKKGFSLEQVHEAVTSTQQAGIEAGLFILVGYPGETFYDLRQTLSMIRKMRPDACGNSVAYPIMGTPFYHEVQQQLSENYSWSTRNENRIAFRGRYPEMFYWFAIRLMNNWSFLWRTRKQPPSLLLRISWILKILITAKAVFLISFFYDLKAKFTTNNGDT